MALNYEEAIAELRTEADRLEREQEQVKAAIQGLIILRNRARMSELPQTPPPLASWGITRPGRFGGVGPTKAIQETLKSATYPMNTREIYDAMVAEGWSSDAQKPVGVISATLIQLEKNGIAERVGERWRLRNRLDNPLSIAISDATSEAIASERPS